MEKKIFDQFIQSLEVNVNENPTNVDGFKMFQEESLELLSNFVKSAPISYESMRLLTRLKLSIIQVRHSMYSKKGVAIQLQIFNHTLNILSVQ